MSHRHQPCDFLMQCQSYSGCCACWLSFIALLLHIEPVLAAVKWQKVLCIGDNVAYLQALVAHELETIHYGIEQYSNLFNFYLTHFGSGPNPLCNIMARTHTKCDTTLDFWQRRFVHPRQSNRNACRKNANRAKVSLLSAAASLVSAALWAIISSAMSYPPLDTLVTKFRHVHPSQCCVSCCRVLRCCAQRSLHCRIYEATPGTRMFIDEMPCEIVALENVRPEVEQYR